MLSKNIKTFSEFVRLMEENAGQVHHASVVPLVGFSPISHMGHAKDLGSKLKSLPGKHHIGISDKADTYSGKERAKILHKQWDHKGLKTHVAKSGGETIAKAYHSLPKTGKKVLHILVGHDRKEMAHGIKKSLEAGKVKEMNGKHWDEIHIHHPEDTDRSHGMSGTNLRKAAHEGNLKEFHKHLGPMFSEKEAKEHMHKIKTAIDSGKLDLKR